MFLCASQEHPVSHCEEQDVGLISTLTCVQILMTGQVILTSHLILSLYFAFPYPRS